MSLMSQGRALLIAALQGGTKPKIDSFVVGAAAAFTPNLGDSVGPTPVLYTGNASQIFKTVINADEIQLHAIIPNNVAIANVGNVLLKSGNAPFAWIILRKAVPKQTIDNVKHFGGSLFHQSIILRIPRIVSLLDLSSTPDLYSQPKVIPNFDTLKHPVETNAREVLIEDDNRHYLNQDRPVWMANIQNQWWGIPGMRKFDDPDFGVIGGGEVGDGYR